MGEEDRRRDVRGERIGETPEVLPVGRELQGDDEGRKQVQSVLDGTDVG